MLLLVGDRVREDAGLDEGEGHLALPRGVAVLAVVQDSRAVAAFGDVGPLMGADLELGDIPEGVVVGRAGQVAELDVVGRLVGVEVKIKLRLEEDLVLLPVDPGVKVDVAAVRVEADVLDNGGVEEFALDPQGGADGAFLGPFHRTDVVDQPGFLGVVDVDVPVVVVHRLILIRFEDVAALARLEQLAAGLLVVDGGEEAAVVEGDGVEGGLDAALGNGQTVVRSRFRSRREGLPAFGRDGADPADGAVCALLDGVEGAVAALEGFDVLRDRNHSVAVKGSGVEDDVGAFLRTGVGGQEGGAVLDEGVGAGNKVLVLDLGDLVDVVDAGTGENVVELV